MRWKRSHRSHRSHGALLRTEPLLNSRPWALFPLFFLSFFLHGAHRLFHALSIHPSNAAHTAGASQPRCHAPILWRRLSPSGVASDVVAWQEHYGRSTHADPSPVAAARGTSDGAGGQGKGSGLRAAGGTKAPRKERDEVTALLQQRMERQQQRQQGQQGALGRKGQAGAEGAPPPAPRPPPPAVQRYEPPPPPAVQLYDRVVRDPSNYLRPEFVESLWYLYRATRHEVYREWGWAVFRAFEQYSRVEIGGYARLVFADGTDDFKGDRQESFWLAETLKYLFLLFDDDDAQPLLGQYVLNTEAHPLPVWGSHAEQVVLRRLGIEARELDLWHLPWP